MKKVGCSNISVLFTAFGAVPLFISVIAIYNEISLGTEISDLAPVIPIIIFSLLACGYRSCLFINNETVEIKKSVYGKKIRNKKFKIRNYKNIFIDIGSHANDDGGSNNFYTMAMIGLDNTTNPLEFTEFLGVKASISDKSWNKVNSIAGSLSKITGLTVGFSDKVKEVNEI